MKKSKNIRFLIRRAWKMSKRLCFITILKGVFDAFVPLVNIAGLGFIIDALVTGASYENILRLIIIYLSVNLSISVAGEIITWLNNKVSRVISNTMQFDYSEDSVNVNYHYVQDRTVMNLRRDSMSAHPSLFLDSMNAFLRYVIQFAGLAYIFLILSPLFLVILGVMSSVSVYLIFKTRNNNFDFQINKTEEDRKLDYLYEVMTDYKFAKEIRINRASGYIKNKYACTLKCQIIKLKELFSKSMKISLASAVITVLQTALMYFYFSYQVYTGAIEIAEYTVLLASTTLLVSLLSSFFENIASLNDTCKYVAFYNKYKNLIETESSITASNALEERSIDFSNPTIEFKNVSFTYPETDRPILKNINFKIKDGEKIGIVGLNGSGKTTFIKLLTRLYDPTEGCITINGVDIREIPHRQYISHISIVLQDFLLYAYSVKENIILDSEYDEAKFASSIEKSGIKEKIAGLTGGINTSVHKTLDKNGIEFSGGEEQKLALARAIYKDAEILILDEPTSALDPIAEYELFSKLNDISENKATIFISHRGGSTKFCDKIIVIDKGAIIESGNHETLISSNGFYAELFNTQAKYYKEEEGIVL